MTVNIVGVDGPNSFLSFSLQVWRSQADRNSGSIAPYLEDYLALQGPDFLTYFSDTVLSQQNVTPYSQLYSYLNQTTPTIDTINWDDWEEDA